MAGALLLDTSYVVALANRQDAYHKRALYWDERISSNGVVCVLHTGILLEIGDGFARQARRAMGCSFLERFTHELGYEVVEISGALLTQAIDLFLARPDKSWGLTDCVSFVLMKERGITDALTADVHFQQAGFRALLLES